MAISTGVFSKFATEINNCMKKITLFFVALLCTSLAGAKVILPQLFQSGMVIQRGKPVPVWGKADAGETVTIAFNKKEYTTIADAEGR